MTYCYIYQSCKAANDALREFAKRKETEVKIKKIDLFTKKVKTKDGNEHYFISELEYHRWSLGREYMLNGKLMRSGYEIEEK